MTRKVSAIRRSESSSLVWSKSYPVGDLVIEQGDVAVQRLLVELLLVVGPAELVQGQLVVLGTDARCDDGRIGLFRLAEALSREEVLRPPELRLVDVSGVRVGRDQVLDDGDRLVRPAQLVEGARLLVEDLVVVFVQRIGLEDPVVQRDGLHGPARRRRVRAGQLQIEGSALGPEAAGEGRAPLEVLLGLRVVRDDSARTARRCASDRVRHDVRLGSGRLQELPVAADSVLLLQLEVGEPPHRLRSEGRLRRLLEESLVAAHGLIEAVLDAYFRQVGPHPAEFGQGASVASPGACGQETRCEQARVVRVRRMGSHSSLRLRLRSAVVAVCEREPGLVLVGLESLPSHPELPVRDGLQDLALSGHQGGELLA